MKLTDKRRKQRRAGIKVFAGLIHTHGRDAVSAATGLASPFISNILAGRRPLPFDAVDKITAAFGVPGYRLRPDVMQPPPAAPAICETRGD